MDSPTGPIAELLRGTGRYEPENLPQLEEYLKEQLTEGTYDLEANLAILKLYLLVPEETKVDIIEGILLKALMNLGAKDFSLCMYQIPEKYHSTLKDVMKLAQLLEMAKFKQFWLESGEVEVLEKATGWQEAIRDFIGGVVSCTYRSISAGSFAELLNVTPDKIPEIAAKKGWSMSGDSVVVNENTFETRAVEPETSTTLTLDQYRSLILAAS